MNKLNLKDLSKGQMITGIIGGLTCLCLLFLSIITIEIRGVNVVSAGFFDLLGGKNEALCELFDGTSSFAIMTLISIIAAGATVYFVIWKDGEYAVSASVVGLFALVMIFFVIVTNERVESMVGEDYGTGMSLFDFLGAGYIIGFIGHVANIVFLSKFKEKF